MRNSLFWIAALLPLLIVVLPLGKYLLSLSPSPALVSELTSVVLAAVLLLSTRLDSKTLGSAP